MPVKQTLITEALQLSEAERIELAEALYESVEGPADPDAAEAWSEEIARRLSEIDAGRARLVPWDQARRQIRGEDSHGSTAS